MNWKIIVSLLSGTVFEYNIQNNARVRSMDEAQRAVMDMAHNGFFRDIEEGNRSAGVVFYPAETIDRIEIRPVK